MTNKKLTTFDTTLRDGAQSPGVSFTVKDKLHIIELLDSFGIDFIEAGNPGGIPKDRELFRLLRGRNFRSRVCAFTSSCRAGTSAENDGGLIAAVEAGTMYVSLVAKASAFQAETVLRTSREENLRIIRDSIRFLCDRGKRVIFDAEHFFDGYRDFPEYSAEVVKAAFDEGAECVVLCDTNGGTLPGEIAKMTRTMTEMFPEKNIGIHCHNDLGMAEAATLRACEEGASHIQATFLGFGERCGNADFTTLLPVIAFKTDYWISCKNNLIGLSMLSRRISDIANMTFDEKRPFVGEYAFTHKAGMHVDAIIKAPKASEQIEPELVGNMRHIAVGELSGKSAVLEKVRELEPSIERTSPVLDKLLSRIKDQEKNGYYYENADASLKLIILEALGRRKRFFKLETFKVLLSEPDSKAPACAMIKINVDGIEETTAAEGNGPVNAMDMALRKALVAFYPVLKNMRLIDYRVRVLDSDSATGATTRVLIESGEGGKTWNTVGVSTDIIEASWHALLDSIDYYLMEKGYEGISI